MNDRIRIAIIGAGASGMTAAVTAAKQGAEVTLYEKNDRVGKKILATGNGKCNLSNLKFTIDQYYCNDKEKLQKIFNVFSVWDTVSFFESMGLMVKSKNEGLYPYSEQASAVLDVLRMELRRNQVKTVPETEIEKIIFRRERAVFEVKDGNKEVCCYDRLILACGSPASMKNKNMSGYKLAEGFGHKINPIVPGLVQLKSDEAFCRALAGVRCFAKVTLMIDEHSEGEEIGEVQFTEYGVSGIPVFQISRTAAYALKEGKDVKLLVDFFPDQEDKAFLHLSRLRYESQKDKTLEEFLTGTLNKKINMVLIKRNGLKSGMKAEDAGFKKLKDLFLQSRNFSIHISDVNSIENAQVCAGGVDFGEIDIQMQSVKVPGLYFAGEIIDVDGKCGGYNLQWAWTSGYVAGMNAAGCSTVGIAEGLRENK